MSGDYVLDMAKPGQFRIEKAFDTAYPELWVTFRIRWISIAIWRSIMWVKDSNNLHTLGIELDSTGFLSVRRGDYNDTELDHGTWQPVANQTYFFKVHYKPLNADGVITVDIDGVEQASYSGDSTLGLEEIRTIKFGVYDSGNGTAFFYLDDVVVSTTDITENLRVGGRAVSAAGATTQFDPSAGANYECVGPDNTSYNSTNTTNEIDTFTIADGTEEIGTVAAVQLELTCAYDGSPTPTHIQHVARSGGADYPSLVDKSPPTSFGAPIIHIWEVNPADAAAFEAADLIGASRIEIGYKATA
jgi:hypothetical protein